MKTPRMKDFFVSLMVMMHVVVAIITNLLIIFYIGLVLAGA